MKAILQFDMYEDKEAFELYYKAMDYVNIIEDFENWMKNKEERLDSFSLLEVKAAWYKIKEDNLSLIGNTFL